MDDRGQSERLTRILKGAALVILGLSLVLLLLWWIDSGIVQPAFQRLEQQQAIEDSGRVRSAIENELSSLADQANDWANWDDTFAFAQGNNSGYIASNYPDPALSSRNSNIDLLAIYDSRGKELLYGNFHPGIGKTVVVQPFSGTAPAIITLIAPVLLEGKQMTGLLHTNQGLLMLAARPIHDTKSEGASRGCLIMGRFLSQPVLLSIARRVSVPFDLLIEPGGRFSDSERDLFTRLASASRDFKMEFQERSLYEIYPDIIGRPLFLLRTPLRGEITKLGRHTGNILSSTLGLIALALLICLVTYRSRMKASEAELRESERRYKTLFENNHTVMLLIDSKTSAIVDANPAACAFFDWNREDMLSQTLYETDILPQEKLSAETAPEHSDRRTPVLSRFRRPDGTFRDVEVYSMPLSLKGRALRFSIVHDVTERLAAEAGRTQLEARTGQLQKSESLTRMAGAIAHHFNNQLGVVIGNLEMAIDDLPSDAELAGNLTNAMQGARKAAEVSGLMLTYLGQTAGRHANIDLSGVCRRHLPMLQATYFKDMVLDIDLPSSGPIISANRNEIQQILANLITNAWEAIGGHRGAIVVRVREVKPGDIPTTHRYPPDWQPQNGVYACLEVTDRGCGIAQEDIDKLFDPFFSSKFTGRGLGLAVVLGIVKAHDGAVTVESEIGLGSTFRVYLLVSGESMPQEAERTVPVLEIQGGGVVLLADDESAVLEMTQAMLERLGFSVITARDGIEATELFRRHADEIRFVFCDLTMPRMDGFDTFRTLREMDADAKIILSSGYSREMIIDRFSGMDFPVFLHKPFTMEELSASIREVLAG